MSNWYYYDNNGQKQGPVNVAQLKVLSLRGIITPDTFIENASGHSRMAGTVSGLDFSSRSSAIPVPPSVPPNPPTLPNSPSVPLQHKENSRTNDVPFTDFKTKPSLKWFFDLQFNLCYFFCVCKRMYPNYLCFISCGLHSLPVCWSHCTICSRLVRISFLLGYYGRV